MGKNSEILWTEHTFNTHWGCTKISEGCAHCYAESFSKRVGFKIWGQDAERRTFGDKHWAEPLRWNAAAAKLGVMHRVFCGSMCDIFENRMDLDTHRLRVFRLVQETPNLLWLFLTKRPQYAVQMLPSEWRGSGNWPRNVMVGVTIENQARLVERMPYIELLDKMFPGVNIFASCEPLLSALNWERGNSSWLELFSWIVGGGESGHGARPCHPDWARKLRDDCRFRDDMCRPWPLPFLWKQWGEWVAHGPHNAKVTFTSAGIDVGENQMLLESGIRPGRTLLTRIGKKAAGRSIDGIEWAEVPRLAYGVQIGVPA